jgi:hypothetical protein
VIIDSRAIEPGKDSYSIGPTLPAELPRLPYRPKVAGKIAFFFGPVAGALVSVINLRRFGYPLKAKRILLWTLLAAAVLSVVFIVTPDILGRFIGLGAEIAFYKVYPPLQEKEFDEWQSAHSDLAPMNGWKALGWGFAGLGLFFVIFMAVAFALGMIFPSLG